MLVKSAFNMDDERHFYKQPSVVRRLMDFYSCDEDERQSGARPWVSTSDSDTSDSNHKSSPIPVPFRHSTHKGGYCSDSSPCKNLPPIGVFWDIENCQIPRGRSAVAVAQAIRDKFLDGYREAEFLVVCDVKKEASIVIQELNDAQVNLIHVGSQSKNAADEKLRQSIRRFADLHGSLAAVVLISGDINFAPDLCDLRHRKKIRVILVHNDVCSESLILCANEHFRFSDLVTSLPLRGTVKSIQPAEVMVSALPVTWEPARVRQKLKRLAENSGGKVCMVVGDLATIRFPSVESATRAQKRMDGERVFGSQITVGNPVVIQGQRFNSNREMSPQKGYNRRTTGRRDEDTTWGSQPATFNKITNGYSVASIKPYQGLVFNQENDPLPVPEPLWKSGCNFPIQPSAKQPQIVLKTNNGRPILGRRNEPNIQHNVNAKNQSGRHSLDSMLDWGEFHGDSKLSRPPSLDNWAATYAQEEPKNVLGVDFSMPPPPIVNLPRKENEYLFHPIPVKPNGLKMEAVDLLVSNLDENISAADLRNLLFLAFNQHCRVLDVSVFRHSTGLLAAHVKVGSQQDAQQAVSAMQKHMIGLTPIHITYAAAPSVVSNGHDRSPSSASSCSDAGVPETRFCPRHFDHGRLHTALPSVMVKMSDFGARLRILVDSHDNRLPLTSLMDRYAAHFEPLVRDNQGVPLEHLVTCVSGLDLTESAGNKFICPSVASPPETESQVVNAKIQPLLRQLTQELKELLKTQPKCCMYFGRLTPAYRRHFGYSFKLSDFGCDKLIDLFKFLHKAFQVIKGDGTKKVLTMSHASQMRRFAVDLLRVLRSQPNKQVLLIDLPAVWQTVIGKRLQANDYGLCYVDDLLELVPSLVLVSGYGDQRIVAVNTKEQTDEERERTKLFGQEVAEVLRQQPDFTVDFTKFIPLYHHLFHKQVRVADYGFTKLIDLFDAIPHIAKVEGESDPGRKVSLSLSERLKSLDRQLVLLVQSRQPVGLPFHSINSTYLWHYGVALKPSTYHCHNIDELLTKLPTLQVETAEDGSRLLVLVDHALLRILCLRALRILWERSGAKTTVKDFEAAFLHYYKEPCTMRTLTQLNNIVQVTEEGYVELTRLQLFACDVYRLLCASDGCMALSVFEATYRDTLRAAVSPAQYGYASVSELLAAIDHVVTVSTKGVKKDLVLNAQLGDVGIYLPPELTKNGHQVTVTPQSEVPVYPPSSTILLNGSNSKTVKNKTPTAVPKNSSDSKKAAVSKKTFKIKAAGSERQGLVLLSPAEFLRPTCALAFLPSSPDPSALPKPGDFNLTQEKNGFNQQNLHLLDEADNKRKLRLAAHFGSELQLN